MTKEMICIACPVGCRLTVQTSEDGFKVTGNGCPRGITYGIQEMTDPRRMVTTTVCVSGGERRVVPVKTSQPIPKDEMFRFVAALRDLVIPAPVLPGQILAENLLSLGADVVATRGVKARPEDPSD